MSQTIAQYVGFKTLLISLQSQEREKKEISNVYVRLNKGTSISHVLL